MIETPCRSSRLGVMGRALMLLGFAGILTHCGNSSSDKSSTDASFTHIYTKTLSTACAGCHNPTGVPTVQDGVQLDFSSQAAAYQSLSTRSVSGASSSGICPGVKIVVAGDPANSYLMAVLFSDYAHANFGGVTGCTPYSAHLTDQNLSADEKASILGWIQAGANNN